MPPALTNRFLDALSPASRQSLLDRCVEVDLPLKKSLYSAECVPQYGYFITSGIASIVTSMEDGSTAEVGLVGREGVIGSFHVLGPAKVTTNSFVQLPATALRLPFSELLKAFRSNEEIRTRMLELVQEQALTLSQLAGCNRLHENEERLSRWLLMAHDRTGVRCAGVYAGVSGDDAGDATNDRDGDCRGAAAERAD